MKQKNKQTDTQKWGIISHRNKHKIWTEVTVIQDYKYKPLTVERIAMYPLLSIMSVDLTLETSTIVSDSLKHENWVKSQPSNSRKSWLYLSVVGYPTSHSWAKNNNTKYESIKYWQQLYKTSASKVEPRQMTHLCSKVSIFTLISWKLTMKNSKFNIRPVHFLYSAEKGLNYAQLIMPDWI